MLLALTVDRVAGSWNITHHVARHCPARILKVQPAGCTFYWQDTVRPEFFIRVHLLRARHCPPPYSSAGAPVTGPDTFQPTMLRCSMVAGRDAPFTGKRHCPFSLTRPHRGEDFARSGGQVGRKSLGPDQ